VSAKRSQQSADDGAEHLALGLRLAALYQLRPGARCSDLREDAYGEPRCQTPRLTPPPGLGTHAVIFCLIEFPSQSRNRSRTRSHIPPRRCTDGVKRFAMPRPRPAKCQPDFWVGRGLFSPSAPRPRRREIPLDGAVVRF
jgi:hypothetical protein